MFPIFVFIVFYIVICSLFLMLMRVNKTLRKVLYALSRSYTIIGSVLEALSENDVDIEYVRDVLASELEFADIIAEEYGQKQ